MLELEEKLLQLDKKVSSLLDELRRSREDTAALRAETETLKPQAAEAVRLRQESEAQRQRIAALEKDAGDHSERELGFRDRLRTIIEKIDALEQTAEE